MDLFDILIVAALALPAIIRWLGERSKKGQPPPAEAPTRSERDEAGGPVTSEFQRALREIGLALGTTQQEPAPREVARTTVVRSQANAAGSDLQSAGGYSREESFENRPEEKWGSAAAKFRKLKLSRIEAPDVEEASTGARRAAGVHSLLRTPPTTRRAILLAEVLGPPRSFRPYAAADEEML